MNVANKPIYYKKPFFTATNERLLVNKKNHTIYQIITRIMKDAYDKWNSIYIEKIVYA